MKKEKVMYKSLFLRGEDLKKGLLTAKGAPMGFNPVDSDIPWINADRLYALWNIGYCLGKMTTEEFTGKIMVGFKLEKTNNIVLQMFPQGFTISISDGSGVINGGVELLELKNGLRVIWQKTLTCLMVDSFINKTYEQARSFGEITNNVLHFEEDSIVEAEELMNVDALFSICGIVGPFYLEAEDEKIFENFDKPELLCSITTDFCKFVCLKVEKTEYEKEINLQIQRFKEEGINVDTLNDFDWQMILNVREKIQL